VAAAPAGSAPVHEDHGASLEDWAARRRPYLDNLKVVLITAIIAIHGVLGYASSIEVWTYTELREVSLHPVTEIVLFVLVSPLGLFLIPLLFLVAGLLTPPSLERKGTRAFVRDRLLRLGLPFAIYVFLVQPTLNDALQRRLGLTRGSYLDEYMRPEGRVDTGPLWFVGVLLIFSLGYAGAHAALSPRRHSGPARRPQVPPAQHRPVVTVPFLALTAVAVAPLSFLVRLVYPYGSESGVTDLNFWEWPACLAVFVIGVVAAEQGWVRAVPPRLAHRCAEVTLAAVLAMGALLAGVGSADAMEDALGGWGWPAAAFAVVDAVLSVFGSVWLLSVAQRRLDRRYRWGPVLSRSAYGAFMLQSVFLLGVAVVLRPVEVAAEVKAAIVATGGVVLSYAAAWLLISRVPGMHRVL
jgi:hypothetical protein